MSDMPPLADDHLIVGDKLVPGDAMVDPDRHTVDQSEIDDDSILSVDYEVPPVEDTPVDDHATPSPLPESG